MIPITVGKIVRRGVGGKDVEADVIGIVGNQRQQRDEVESQPEEADDLLEKREAGEVFRPGGTTRDGTTRHETG